MQYLILGLMALAVVIWASKKFVSANPASLARQTRTIGGVASIIVAGLLAMRGALQFAAPLALFGFGLLNGGFSFGSSQKSAGQISKVRTEFLEMELDHDSGDMSGLVLNGMFEGQDLVDLDLDFLMELWTECQSDPQSVQLLEAYLDRAHEDWRAHAGAGNGGDGRRGQNDASGQVEMSRDEAFEILGLVDGASVDAIHEAHRTLMMKNHPDQGGSTYLAAKINQAKDVALG